MQRPSPPVRTERIQRQVPDREDIRAVLRRHATLVRDHLASDHRRNDRPAREFADRRGHHSPAVAQHGDAVRKLQDLLDAVRGIDDRYALACELAYDLEQRVAFRGGQGRGRLVHDQNAGIERQRLGDLDELLLADAQAGNPGFGRNGHAKPRKQAFRRTNQAAPVDQHTTDQRLAAKEDILRHAQLGDEIELLVDNGHAGVFGITHVAERHRAARDPDVAVVARVHAGEDLHQGALSGSVLAHQRVHFAVAQIEIDAMKGLDTREGFGDLLCAQHVVAARPPGASAKLDHARRDAPSFGAERGQGCLHGIISSRPSLEDDPRRRCSLLL
ncbi:hypothetical protein BRAS3843_1310047 [Bradyrhizobium sp. STM 3843]|nr:hypothetical protein BRAS3843_1310047 [Bradyrhizobium sp. STM 3843]